MSKKPKNQLVAAAPPPAVIMDASDKLLQELTIATDASVNIIVVRVPETEVYRVVDDLYSLAMAQNTEFQLHTAETGWATFERADPDDKYAPAFDPLKYKLANLPTADVGKAFAYLSTDKAPEEGFYVMLDLFYTFGEMRTQTSIRKQHQRGLSNGQRLFCVVPLHATVPDAIAPLVHVIEFGYPTRSELNQSLDDILDSIDEADRPALTDEERSAIISNGQGMTTHSFETAIALSITEHSVLHDNLDDYEAEHIVKMIREYKTQLLRKTNVLELQPSVPLEDIGGLDLFKAWMLERKATYTDEAKRFNVLPSRGALVIGPPGTGKSLVAKAAGSILNMPVIRFDVGRVFGAYIGQSEGAMRNVLSMIDAMAPCVLMLDEIDKGFAGMNGGGDHDGGTTQRVFGTFLTWMQERDQQNRPVFLIMTANRVHGLPPELLRKGRIDEIWSVNVPHDEERRQIITIHARRRNQHIEDDAMPALVRITDQLVGSEIEALIEDAMVISLSEGEPGLTYEYLERSKSFLKPMSSTRADDFRAMREWAEHNARPASSSSLQSIASTDSKSKSGRKISRGGVRKRVRVDRE